MSPAIALLAAVLAAPAGPPAPRARPLLAVRAGWVYGLGGELELRPGQWGVGIGGGYVPGFGPGGYLGAQWGLRPLDASGPVAEAGLFYGEHSPLRAAASGPGLYALAGYALVPAGRLSLRLAAGGGLPFAFVDGRPSFEFLAKLTAGWAW